MKAEPWHYCIKLHAFLCLVVLVTRTSTDVIIDQDLNVHVNDPAFLHCGDETNYIKVKEIMSWEVNRTLLLSRPSQGASVVRLNQDKFNATRYEFVETNHTLIIKSVTKEDTGQYKCQDDRAKHVYRVNLTITFVCPAGNYISGPADNLTCLPCEVNTYKQADDYYATNCTPCTGGLKTAGPGATSEADCRFATCEAGQMLNLDQPAECMDCDFDFYQENPDPLYLVDNCTKCPNNTGTRQNKTASVELCQGYCASGEEFVNGSCQECAQGFYKRNTDLFDRYEPCTQCPSDQTTQNNGSTGPGDCSDIINDDPGSFEDNNDDKSGGVTFFTSAVAALVSLLLLLALVV